MKPFTLKRFVLLSLIVLSLILTTGCHLLSHYSEEEVQQYINVNVNIRMYNFDDVQCTVIPSVAYGFVTGMNHQLCLSHGHGEVIDQQ